MKLHRADKSRISIFGILLLLILSGPSQAQPALGGAGKSGPSEVGVVTLKEEAIPVTLTSPGRAVAYQQAFIRPRVEGVIEEITYEPGRPVARDTVLFRLESDTYEANLAAAKAEVESARATLVSAETSFKRYESLLGSGITQEELDNADVARLQAKAALSVSEAALKLAQLNLSRTEIRSPIDGIADVSAVSIGAIVTANQADALTSVTQLDPIYVDVAESSARMQRMREQTNSGALSPDETRRIDLKLENGDIYELEGTLVTPGVQVSATTGTVNIRFQFDNPDRKILPGQFLRAEATLGTSKAILVPQRATSRAANGDLTAFIVKDGKAVSTTLSESGSYANGWIVTQGVEAGDQLIVDGLRNLREGSEIKPVPVTIDEDGVVHDQAQPATPAR